MTDIRRNLTDQFPVETRNVQKRRRRGFEGDSLRSDKFHGMGKTHAQGQLVIRDRPFVTDTFDLQGLRETFRNAVHRVRKKLPI